MSKLKSQIISVPFLDSSVNATHNYYISILKPK